MSAIGRPEDIEEETARRLTRIGVVGLGTGAMACYRRPGDRWTFFEIDPAVVRIARDTSLFRYLSECAPNGRIIIGDGRILLREESDGAYDLLVLDAFSSDAVPVHLLTSEAISLYLAKLAPDGMLVVHISNRYLELDRVVSAVALRADLVGRIRSYEVSDSLEETGSGITGSDWAVVAREDADLGSLAQDSSWIPLGQQAKGPLWTDDHSNLVSVLRW